MRALGYVRVSTLEQADDGAGIGAQRAAIARASDSRDWELCDVLEDAGYSAKDLNRPALQGALELLEHGHYDVLMVAKLDRLSRSLLDFTGLMETSRRQGWGLITLDLNVDTTTPAGEMMMNVLATFAQFERRLISQRTKEGLAIKRAQGVKLGAPRRLPPERYTELLEMRAEGAVSYEKIAAELNRRGVPTAGHAPVWTGPNVRRVCRRAADDRSEMETQEARGSSDLR